MRLLPILFIVSSVECRRRQDKENERLKSMNVPLYPEKVGQAVDFGHVYRNGDNEQFGDIELDMVEPRSVGHARELLKKIGVNVETINKPEDFKLFASPRDAMLYKDPIQQIINNKNTLQSPARTPKKTPIQSIQEKTKKEYLGHFPNIKEDVPSGDVPSEIQTQESNEHKERFFSRSGFDLVSDKRSNAGNWTTCKEFAKNAVFHPDDVVNLPWVPFFIWSTRGFAISTVHTLKYPTKKLVNQYKKDFGPYLNKQLDWQQPKLLLRESIDMLLIAGDRKGLFYGIPYVELPSSKKNLKITLDVVMIRMKIIDPYLALMYCNENYAIIMSVAGTGPETDEEKTSEAEILKFKGFGNPARRDLELEGHRSKHNFERQKDEKSKNIDVK